MAAVLIDYLNGLDNLEFHTNRIGLINDLLGLAINPKSTNPVEKQVLSIQAQNIGLINQKQFNYSSIIISLYGYFENFVEELVRFYIKELNAFVPDFSALHQNIVKFHVDLSFQLIQKLSSTRYSSRFTLEGIIANLHSCASGATNYLVNQEAFTLHEANLRPNTINDIFNRVGIENIFRRSVRETSLIKYLLIEGAGGSYEQKPTEDEISLAENTAKNYVVELAERRNEISHGVPSNLLGESELLKYISFFKMLGKSLFTIVWREILPYKVSHQSTVLGKPIKVFNNKIVAFELENIDISVGDVLVGVREHNPITYLAWEIDEIQIDNQPFSSVNLAGATKIALKVKHVSEYQCKPNYTYSLVKQSNYQHLAITL